MYLFLNLIQLFFDYFRLLLKIAWYPAWQKARCSGLEATGILAELDHGLECGNGQMGQLSATQIGETLNLMIDATAKSSTLK